MTDTNSTPTHPGSRWAWITAWSLQGGVILLVPKFGIESWVLAYSVTGVLAAVPLVGLYLYLRRPATP